MTLLEKTEVLKRLVNAIIDTVKEAGPLGAPRGPMYLAFMNKGATLEQYEQIEKVAIDAGVIIRRGDLLFMAPRP